MTLLLFLLLGAIVNVAVAWGCAFHPEWKGPPRSRPTNDDEDAWLRKNNEAAARDISESTGFGVDLWDCDLADTDWDGDPESATRPRRPFQVLRYTAGLPLRCLTGDIWFHSRDWSRARNRPARINQPPLDEGIWRTNSAMLPLRPIWPGFAINTILYAVILWLLFAAPFGVRRRRRVRKGLCPKCAYPIGAGDTCTECGTPVTSRKSNAQ